MKPRKELMVKRNSIIPIFNKMEKMHGAEVVRSAMRKHLMVVTQTRLRERRIKQLETEIAQIKSK